VPDEAKRRVQVRKKEKDVFGRLGGAGVKRQSSVEGDSMSPNIRNRRKEKRHLQAGEELGNEKRGFPSQKPRKMAQEMEA